LKEKPKVLIPDDNRFLVEKATHPEVLDSLTGERWIQHRNLIYGKGLAKSIAASTITNMFDQYFGQIEFVEAGRAVATRLGADQLRLPLDRRVVSPFGETLTEMIIPGHMAPNELNDGVIAVEEEGGGVVILRCEERRYRYSKYGLEEVS